MTSRGQESTGTQVRWARGLIVAASVAHAVAYLVAAPEHVVDPAWPEHARFHVAQSLVVLVAFDVALVVLALRVYPTGGRSAWWTLALGGLGLHSAYFLSFAVGGQPHELSAHLVLGGIAAVYVAGLAVGWRGLSGSHAGA